MKTLPSGFALWSESLKRQWRNQQPVRMVKIHRGTYDVFRGDELLGTVEQGFQDLWGSRLPQRIGKRRKLLGAYYGTRAEALADLVDYTAALRAEGEGENG